MGDPIVLFVPLFARLCLYWRRSFAKSFADVLPSLGNHFGVFTDSPSSSP